MSEDYGKMKIAIRSWLSGRGYFKALKALDFAESKHTGTRKDGAHEFSHQISQANYMRVFADQLEYPEETFCVIFLHDIAEDYNVTFEDLVDQFGPLIGSSVRRMTKVYQGAKIPNDLYYSGMWSCPIASVAKGADRLHNLMTMLGGFSSEKQIEYIKETTEFVLPLIKKSRRFFPKQEGIYFNMKYVMTNQIKLYNEINKELLLCQAQTSELN